MNTRLALTFGCLALTTLPVNAGEPSSFEALWNAIARDPGCKPSQFPDFVVFSCERNYTFWYLTKPNHPAHPGIIKRYLFEKDGTWYVKEEGHSFGSDAAQPAFSAWLAQIEDMDRQAQESIKKQQNQSPAGHSN
jgi:hypothetical protein